MRHLALFSFAHLCAAATSLAITAGLALAQDSWELLRTAPATLEPLAVYDSVAGTTVVLSGTTGRTWSWDGLRWAVLSETGPGPIASGLITYDSTRARAVLFNGDNGTTWSWNGTSWTQLASTGPSPRDLAAFCYDSARDRVVLHGGSQMLGTVTLNDTWEWDGTNWQQVSTAGPPTSSHGMVFNTALSATLLHGGFPDFGASPSTATWSWDGQTWTQQTTMGPPSNSRTIMAYDDSRNVVVAHLSGASPFFALRTWELTGTASWTQTGQLQSAIALPRTLVFDRARRVVVGIGPRATAEWSGSQWTVPQEGSLLGFYAKAAFDEARQELLAVGAAVRAASYAWNGTSWRTVSTASFPSIYRAAALTNDPLRSRVVLFGGFIGPGAETWEWDGAAWAQLTTPTSATPPAREEHAMAFDPLAGLTLVHGGKDLNGNLLGDTWAWDGTRWTQVATVANGPSPRAAHQLATDTTTGALLLFGGEAAQGADETWMWTGGQWTRLATSGPAPRAHAALGFDPVRDRFVLHGGRDPSNSQTLFDDTWEWDRNCWQQRQPSLGGLSARWRHTLFFDTSRQRMVSFGGVSLSAPAGYGGELTLLRSEFAGAGCVRASSSTTLSLSTDRPALGSPLAVTTTVPPRGSMPALGILGIAPLVGSLELGPIGMPSCALHVDTLIAAPLTPAGAGTAAWNLTMSSDPVFAGLRLFFQVAVPDPAANALGLTLTNAVVALVQ